MMPDCLNSPAFLFLTRHCAGFFIYAGERMPEKDPQSYSLLAYLAFGGLSVWGGFVAYIRTIKATGKPFQLVDALLQVIVSGFAGMLTMLLCWYITAPLPLCGFMAGMAGLMGSKALDIYERRAAGIMRGGKGNGTLD
ncbi:phage holin family protein [Pseudaeromonas pectinilytica]